MEFILHRPQSRSGSHILSLSVCARSSEEVDSLKRIVDILKQYMHNIHITTYGPWDNQGNPTQAVTEIKVCPMFKE